MKWLAGLAERHFHPRPFQLFKPTRHSRVHFSAIIWNLEYHDCKLLFVSDNNSKHQPPLRSKSRQHGASTRISSSNHVVYQGTNDLFNFEMHAVMQDGSASEFHAVFRLAHQMRFLFWGGEQKAVHGGRVIVNSLMTLNN